MGLPKLLPALVPERLLERSHGPLPICNQLQSREWAPLWLLLTGKGNIRGLPSWALFGDAP